MIPILFDKTATDFSSYGLGALADTISCKVTEERNGKYELQLKYPTNGALYDKIQKERIILAQPNDTAQNQAFRIYRIQTPIKNIVTVYAQHISYDLANVGVMPFASPQISPTLAMNRIFTETATEHEFTCESSYSEPKPFSVSRPMSVRACLGGTEGSMLDTWGGEFEWDNFNVKHHVNRGSDTGIVIEYGKNLTDLEHNTDNSAVYTDMLPYAVYSDEQQVEHVVTLTEAILPITGTELTHGKTLIKDMSEFFDTSQEITEDALRGVTQSYIASNPLGVTTPSIDVKFEPLWKIPEYAILLEKVSLCDKVTVKHTALGVSCKTKVIKTEYDTINEKYSSITLGEAKSNFINTVNETVKNSVMGDVEKRLERFPALIASAVKAATDKITGQTGGYVVLKTNEQTGKPYEFLILDQPDIASAQNVWRWNLSGLGYSSTGYEGEYTTAITADGEIVADFITTGTLVANIIKAGVLSSLDGESWWDLESGEVHLTAYATTTELDSISTTIEGVTTQVETQQERSAELQTSIDGINSYVGELTKTIDKIEDGSGETQERVLTLEEQYTQLQQDFQGLTVDVTRRYTGGVNLVQNSAGLNGLSDDWSYTGTIRIDTSTGTRQNTVSGSAFKMTGAATLSQIIPNAVVGASYTFSVKARKDSDGYTGSVKIEYNGDRTEYLINTQDSFDWQEFNLVIDEITEPQITITAQNVDGDFYVADFLIAQGNTYHKWAPAANEIYTNEVKIDKNGITVSNNESSQKTVITNTEFAGYYNDEVIFTLNKDETITKKTTVDGELTVGSTKFIPQASPKGLNIVVLD